MDELRLEGVHDDGEHLVLSDSSGRRSLLAVDQQLRQAVQRARRTPPRRPRQGAEFGPRDIQARFRSGASLEEIVEESGWEPERVRRYEWPILAERGHMAREAQKVELGTRRTEGYRSAFEGAPLTLAQTLETRAPELGIAAASFDWDAWQRPDLLWTVAVRFRVVDPAKAPQDLVDQQAMAQWVFNPANLSVSPEPGWAEHLTAEQGQDRPRDGVFGETRAPRPTPRAAGSAEPGQEAQAQAGAARGEQASTAQDPDGRAAGAQAPDRQSADERASADEAPSEDPAPRPEAVREAVERVGDDDARTTEELLDVLDARRGQRLGTDEEADDRLAAILGRSMGQVDARPRPISAPEDDQLFQQTIQTGRPVGAEAQQPGTAQEADAGQSAETGTTGPSGEDDEPAEQSEADPATDPTHHHEATIHHLGRADAGTSHESDIVEITDDEDDAPAQPTPLRSAAPGPSDGSAADTGDEAPSSEPEQDEADRRPRPRGRIGGKRTRSSVPSWDDIVFGAKND
ncbi:septation protein SepH [Kocuria palustris]|uniref:septation protein SepH n=1 Tax=Kocuria palustris TaxID=71999 RepID=UPI00119E86B9|nr:septation protein SepH [Kocuria palustris]